MLPLYPYRPLLLLLSSLLPTATLAKITTITITAAPSIPSSSPQFVSDALFTSAILNSTNLFRAEHGSPHATYNTTLARAATRYLAGLSASCPFAHSGGPFGENIALGCSDVRGCVDAWGTERREYDYERPGFDKATGHFTQLVWRNSTAVGCGRRLCGERGWYLVCEYWPRGNVIGEFDEQVGRQINGTGSAGAVVPRPGVGILAWPVLAVLGTIGLMW